MTLITSISLFKQLKNQMQWNYNNQIVLLKEILGKENIKEDIIERVISKMTEEFIAIDKDMPIWVNPIILDKIWNILLLRRCSNRIWWGTYWLPWWHLKTSESLEEWITRECLEELWIIVNPKDIEIISLADCLWDKHYIQIWWLVKEYKGIPKIMETNKSDDIWFFNLNNLPNLFFWTKTNIELFKKNKFYDIESNYYKEKNSTSLNSD